MIIWHLKIGGRGDLTGDVLTPSKRGRTGKIKWRSQLSLSTCGTALVSEPMVVLPFGLQALGISK